MRIQEHLASVTEEDLWDHCSESECDGRVGGIWASRQLLVAAGPGGAWLQGHNKFALLGKKKRFPSEG